jgi:hypothetical protein
MEVTMTSNESAPAAYVPGPLTPSELLEVLRLSVRVLRSDAGHDVFTLFDVLIQDYLRDLSPESCIQAARAVLHHLTGIGALEVREPLRALHTWQRRNRDGERPGVVLERAFADTVRTFGNGPSPARIMSRDIERFRAN